MKKIKNKRLIFLIIITLLIIIEIKAFTNSRAEKLLDINGNFIDSSGLLGVEQENVQAMSQEEAGFYVLLPDTINGKKVKKYFVEEKTINDDSEFFEEENNNENIENTISNEDIENTNNTVDTENSTNTETTEEAIQEPLEKPDEELVEESDEENIEENKIEDIEKYNIEKIPGEKIFLTNEESKNKEINILVEYNTKEKDGKLLYLKHLEQTEENNRIILEGYMPVDGELKVQTVQKENVGQLVKEHVSKDAQVKTVYDIKIISENREYEPSDFGEDIQVYITNMDNVDTETQKYKVVHIKGDNTTEEIKQVETKEDSVQFKADNFSEYAIILDEINPDISPEITAILKAPAETRALTTYSNEPDVWDGTVATSFNIGSGTVNDPYLINSGAELAYLASRVNNGTNFAGQYFQLTRDIDLNNREWTPIGDATYSFAGIFNGSGRTIKNATITASGSVTMTTNTMYAFGFFGSIGTGSVYATVENVVFDNINVTFTSSGNVDRSTSNTRGFNIGIVTGSMYNHSKVANVAVLNSSITSTGSIRVRSRTFQICVGGIAGNAQNTRTGTTDPGDGARYSIQNCYVDADINLSTITHYYSNYGDYYISYYAYYMAMVHTGGIIGSIRTQEVWPEYCLYTGNITANGLIGPIFGGRVAATANNDNNTTTYMTNYWNGNQSTSNGTVNMTMTSYYTNTRINSTSYTSTVTSGTSTSRNDTDLMGSVQGNNKGIYTNNISGLLNDFNSRTTDNVNWKYENSELTLISRLTVSVTETATNNYSANVSDLYNIGTYTYKWYNNGTLDEEGNTYECSPSFSTDQEVVIIASDGQYYSTLSFTVERLYIEIEFNVNNSAASVTASLVGTAQPYIDLNDYTFTWYKEDISGEGEVVKEVQGSSGLTLTDLEQYYDYRLVATHSSVNELTVEDSFTFGERIVIYCDYINGNNSRNGLTEDTAVKTLATAYNKLDANGTRNKNIIVLMNDYNDSNETTKFLNSSNNSSFARKATITGKYKDRDYDPDLCFEGYQLGYRYLNQDTTFMYLNFDGYYYTYRNGTIRTSTKSQTYFYLQGFSLTIGEDVVMKNYAKSNTNQGLLGGNAPAFHIFSCWLQYNYSNLPRNNPEVLIKSGAYARIMGGGSPGTSSGQGQTTSHDFTGSASNPFNITITVDIKNSTKTLSASTVTGNLIDYDVNLLGGGSATGNNYSNVTINIKNGTVGRVLGASIGDSQTRPNNWNYPCNTYLGTATVNITGGTTTELYGGCLGRNMGVTSASSTGNTCDSYFYGTATINISGGEVQNNIYGAGAGGVSGYDANSSDTYRSYGQNYTTSVNINISGGTINGSIFGGGYGYTEYLNENTTANDGGFLYGNSNIVISGSPTINGNIYGAGCGYEAYSTKNQIAGMKGNSYIEINDTPTITGTIYGAGAGFTTRANMAKITGTTSIKINTGISNEVYGGGQNAKLAGNSTINIEQGTHTADIYGGGNQGTVEGTATVNIKGDSNTRVFGGGNQATVTDTIVNVIGGTNTEVYGGGNNATVETTSVIITGGTTTTLFGGGNQAEVDETEVRLNNGIVTTIYGSGNQAIADVTNVYLTGGTNGATYGGGNQAGAGETHVYCNGTTFSNIVDGENKASVFGGSNTSGTVTQSNVEVNSGDVPYIYGGNNAGGTTATSNVVVNNGTVTNAFGGNNLGGTTTNSNVIINNGMVTNTYGGGNQATTSTTSVTIHGGVINNVFGGGEQASTGTSSVTTDGGIIQNIYGGGNQAGVTTTNVTTNGGNINNIFGGSNRSGNVTTSNVITNNPSTTGESGGIKMEITSTVEDAGWRMQTYPDYPTYARFTVKVTNNTSNTLEHWNGSIYVEDSILYANYSSTAITENNGLYTFNETNRYYGTNQVAAGATYSFEIEILSKQNIANFTSTCMLSGTDSTGTNLSYTDSKINNIYGGNNQGGKTTTANVTVNGGNVTNVFGGGNEAESNVTNVNINGEVTGSVYGGGNQAGVDTNTNVNLTNATVGDNVYGGGNQGTVTGNTNVKVKDTIINANLFAGGNGASAIVYGNTNLIMHGTLNNITGSVFGGGNRAATGDEISDNSTSTVNIVGGTIGGNVYGGANTSVIYGTANVKIGYDAVGDNTLDRGNIEIVGTVFGGGEANEEGSEVYDFEAISVTQGINILIDGNGHGMLQMTGSIFGSGNASSSAGDSVITIKNYGTYQVPQSNISIQRAKTVTISNSALSLSGTTDRTNEYSSVQFSLSRIDKLKLKNNSTLYLCNGANLLKELDSLVDINGVETKGTVTINRETGENTKNVDNRIYMLEGKNLNVATNEKATTYGDVYGMSFLGLFSNKTNPSTSTGIYQYTNQNGDTIENEGTFILNSYVKARHMDNHDIEADGFYTNTKYKENEEDNNEVGTIKVDYIDTTPPDDLYYIWTVGEAKAVTPIDMDLTASKYATLGTYELLLQGFSVPNTKFVMYGFSSGLKNGISLVDPSTIEAIEPDSTKANSNFGLSMKTGNTGWSVNGTTTFLAENGASRYTGRNEYDKDNSTYTPTLNFCFYHSQNLTVQQQLGELNIMLQVLTPIDDLNDDISYIMININLATALFQDDYYEGAITPGQQFELFTSTDTTITSKSAFSTYFSLFVPSAKQDITIIGTDEDPEAVITQPSKFRDYSTFKRVIVSRNAQDEPYCFPENTKLTMLDMVTNQYYYYVVTSSDVANNKYVYPLEDFIAMGSTNGEFDESNATNLYYNSNMDIIYENFIFHINFADTNLNSDIEGNSLLMELRDSDNETLVGVLGIQRDVMVYNVYHNKDATIELEASLSPETLYLGNILNINANAKFMQTIVNSKSVYDTQYFDKKLGIKISIFDNNGNKLNNDSLFGVNFELDGKTYYPRIDGTTRINVADKVTDVLSRIKMHTENNTTLATGDYKIRLESFGSSDGIYYGLTASDTTELDVRIINSSYGLKVTTQDGHKIVDKETGNTKFGNNYITSTIKYSSGLSNPKIAVSLYRRDYSGIYSQSYTIVDLADYVADNLVPTSREKEYLIFESPISSMTHQMQFKNNLVSGTYKIVYKLYDGENYVGEAYEYVVIK